MKTCESCKHIFFKKAYPDWYVTCGCLIKDRGIVVGQGGGIEELEYSEACDKYEDRK